MISTPDREIANLAILDDTADITADGLPLLVSAAGYEELTPAVEYTPTVVPVDVLIREIPGSHLSNGMVLFWINSAMKIAVTPAGVSQWNTAFSETPDNSEAFSPAISFSEQQTYRFRLTATDVNTFTVSVWAEGVGGTPSVATVTVTDLFDDGNPTVMFGRPSNAIMTALGSDFKIAQGVKFVSAAGELAGPSAVSVTPAAIAATQTRAGQVVGKLATTHDTLGDQQGFGYTLVAGSGDTDNASFQITQGAYLRCAGVLTAGAKSVRIQTKDIYGKTFSAAVTITVS